MANLYNHQLKTVEDARDVIKRLLQMQLHGSEVLLIYSQTDGGWECSWTYKGVEYTRFSAFMRRAVVECHEAGLAGRE